jgi:hypothetical protein
MQLLWIRTSALGTYAAILGSYAWFEREPILAAVGLLPVLLFTLVCALDDRLEKRLWSWERAGSKRLEG